MKLEGPFAPTYGRVFLKEPRQDDLVAADPQWAGGFGAQDRAEIGDAVSFYFPHPDAMEGVEGTGRATRDNHQHRSHPLNGKRIKEWLEDNSVDLRQRKQVLQQLMAQSHLIQDCDESTWNRFIRECKGHGIEDTSRY
ncbi:hypothetical protein GXW82_41745 [Streptacidiphilus sp. 4-A2]|nr:hypothetical protein [Streptacidiphilus sp. 4-A2]